MEKGRVLLAMPCAHGLVKMGAMKTLTEAALALAALGYGVGVSALAGSDVVFARNHLAGGALRDNCTHLLFIDSDMMFPPNLVTRMIQADKDVIGLIYPRRKIDLAKIVEIGRANPQLSEWEVICKAQEYVVRLTERTAFTDGLGRVAGLGMGGTLIKTSALKTLIDEGVVVQHPLKTNVSGPPAPLFSFFDTTTTAEGLELSEDYSFCERWIRRGGEVWGLSSPEVRHTGDFDFRGDVLESLGQPAPPPAAAPPPSPAKKAKSPAR